MGLGSAIGAGLFLGSGSIIHMAGPASMVSYAIASLMVFLVMRALAEMVAARPSLGSFATYAGQAFGPHAEFMLGWLYWLILILVSIAEISGGSAMLAALPEMVSWFPALPQWAWSLLFVVLFGAVNLWGVRRFGEFEFWLSGIKVATIVLFLIVGALMLAGILGDGTTSIDNLLVHGGFAPTGLSGIAAGLMAVMFSFGGIEIVAIAAAETERPATAIRAATRSIAYRILVFYIGSMFVIVCAIPWNQLDPDKSPFVEVMRMANLPGAATFIQIIAIAALMSSFNAQIYGISRMAHSLSCRGEGLGFLTGKARNDVPVNAVLLTLVLALGAVFLNWWIPGEIFTIALKYAGSAVLVVWSFIVLSQMKLHPEFVSEGSLQFAMGGYPWLPALTLLSIAGFAGLMLANDDARPELIGSLLLAGAVWAVAVAREAFRRLHA